MTNPADANYFDFDAWHAEQHGATIPFKILGKVWELPGDCDAAFLLKMQRFEQYAYALGIETGLAELEGREPETVPLPDGIAPEDVQSFSTEGICRRFAGDENVDGWLAAGIPSKMLPAVAKRLFAIYSQGDPDAAIGLPGKAPAVKQPQDRKPKKK